MLLLDDTRVAVFWMMEQSHAGVQDTSAMVVQSTKIPQAFFLQLSEQDGPLLKLKWDDSMLVRYLTMVTSSAGAMISTDKWPMATATATKIILHWLVSHPVSKRRVSMLDTGIPVSQLRPMKYIAGEMGIKENLVMEHLLRTTGLAQVPKSTTSQEVNQFSIMETSRHGRFIQHFQQVLPWVRQTGHCMERQPHQHSLRPPIPSMRTTRAAQVPQPSG